jgi:hypothetical protein
MMKSSTLSRPSVVQNRAPTARAQGALEAQGPAVEAPETRAAPTADQVRQTVPLSLFSETDASGAPVSVSIASLLAAQSPALRALAERAMTAMDRPAIATGHSNGTACGFVG